MVNLLFFHSYTLHLFDKGFEEEPNFVRDVFRFWSFWFFFLHRNLDRQQLRKMAISFDNDRFSRLLSPQLQVLIPSLRLSMDSVSHVAEIFFWKS